ncbi:MAG TPA: hypothetical protein VI248_03875 [Kineosporiaceae bacterium]
MAIRWDVAEQVAPPLRPIARWVQERDGEGRARLVMVWSTPDPDVALTDLRAVEA